MSIFHHHAFRKFTSLLLGAPRRPRHPLLRVLLGVVGVALLLVLLCVGVFVGAAMLVGGLAWRLWVQRGQPVRVRTRSDSIDGDFRVVGKAQLPLAR
ncbi:hypothetical protein [Thermomonas sp.]|uniref:hypothetical protein n=1 Tax=Thermomonas sp. TaxID=1971895 RepID=UPI0035B3BAA3